MSEPGTEGRRQIQAGSKDVVDLSCETTVRSTEGVGEGRKA